ncbi:MAG TPA: flagellar basal-body MS-ring/collar protein FliF [Rhizomicrobium sp.]|nr:flagellar basal-body MS-ring/collar protein FliF [Rhizomicrobium sp.]
MGSSRAARQEDIVPEFFKQVGAARFGVMAGVAAVLTAFFLYIAGAITEPPKTILFSGLESRDAAAVTTKLDGMAVKYDVKDGGTILVPADQVTKLRMALAQDNLPAAGVGYEIFDKSDAFGTTAFVQNINHQRALEGELSRSMQTIEGIEAARVHLVIPERQIFSRDDQQPSASVVLKTAGRMDRGQVLAIQHLVAAAVAGLSPDRVAIVDDRGNLLAGGDDKSGPDALARNQDEDTTNYENGLRQRIESIVASVVGPNHVQVQVAADINYNHTQTTSEDYNPDTKVVRSTQTIEQNSSNTSGGSNAVSVANALPNAQASGGDSSKDTSGRTEETTNYEISKKVTTSTVDGGDVKKLSVAVVVDGSGDTAAAYKPRTPEEMSKITALVKSAMGFDTTRGDQVQVTNMQFVRMDDNTGTPAPKPLLGLDSSYWFKIIEAAIMCVTALLIGLFVAKPLISRMFTAQAAAAGGGSFAIANASPVAGALPAPAAAQAAMAAPEGAAQPAPALPAPAPSIDISRIDGQVSNNSIKKVGEVVSAHPEEALAIIRTWLHQPV